MDPIELIRPFLDEGGRLTAFPSKRKKKIAALFYLSGFFAPDTVYSEKEVNELLKLHHTFSDPATLRRELYDYGFLDRTRDGKEYTLGAAPPSPEELGLL